MNRHAIAARIFNLDYHAIDQALAAKVFHLNYHAIEQVPAPRVLRLNRRHLVPGIFHLNHHVIGQTVAPDHYFSKLRSWWRGLRDAGCSISHTSSWR
jgi:hypothetical protein